MPRILVMLAAFLAVPAVAFGAVLPRATDRSRHRRERDDLHPGPGRHLRLLRQGTLLVLDYRPDDGVSVPSISIAKATRTPGAYTGTDVRFLLPRGATRSS